MTIVMRPEALLVLDEMLLNATKNDRRQEVGTNTANTLDRHNLN